MADVDLRMDRREIAALAFEPGTQLDIRDAAEGFAAFERSLAPHATGAGAGSIDDRASAERGARDVAWDLAHHYMAFQNFGTRFMAGHHFAERALAHYIHT